MTRPARKVTLGKGVGPLKGALSAGCGRACSSLLTIADEPKSRAKPLSPFRYFHSSPELIREVVMLYVRFPLSLRNVEDLLFERGSDLCHETVRLWRAVDLEGEILESFVTKKRDKAAALSFMKRALKRHGSPEAITTDGLRSYGAAMNELGNSEKREVGRWANNRVENSQLPFRRRERAMLRFRQMKSLQKFASVHANVHNHFNQERHLVDRQTYKERRSATLAEWKSLVS
jgi:putative transposase